MKKKARAALCPKAEGYFVRIRTRFSRFEWQLTDKLPLAAAFWRTLAMQFDHDRAKVGRATCRCGYAAPLCGKPLAFRPLRPGFSFFSRLEGSAFQPRGEVREGSSLRKGGAFPPSGAAKPFLPDFDAVVAVSARGAEPLLSDFDAAVLSRRGLR